MAKHLLPLLCLFVSCTPTTISMNQCVDDVDCGESLICDDGTCVAQPDNTCRSDQTQPCGPPAIGPCKPGVFRCVDGAFETTCFGAVFGTDETCNGIDDDCDGTVDNGVIRTYYRDLDGDGFGSSAPNADTRKDCGPPVGFVENASDCDDANAQRKPSASEVCDPFDVDENCDGVANEGCGCSNPGVTQACCSGRGTQTCELQGSSATLSMCTAQPSLELCNGIDDDCDGEADELFLVVSPDGGVPTLDAGTILPDGGCTIGVGACERTAGVACVQGSLSCLAVAGTPGAEVCNAVDDDCDGETDEVTSGLCPAAGQTCSGGACACPSGQTVCGASCETLGGSCSNGVGACARTGSIACLSGGPACNAVPGASSTETCNGIDDDCNGQTDEAVQIQCFRDADDDRYVGSLTPTMQCPDLTRPVFGYCPSGYVAGQSALGGFIDCDDNSPTLFLAAAVRSDGDADGYCDGATFSQCMGTNPPSGWRLASSCQATDDCAISDPARYRVLSVMADMDGDGLCAGSVVSQCTGQSPQPGYKLVPACLPFGGATLPIDCNDGSANEWQFLSVRADGDGDSWCSGVAFSQCTNATPKPGFRLATQCAGTDCRDSNANATSTCQVTVSSQTRVKACGIAIPATQELSFDWQCPAGFQALGSQFQRTNPEARVSDPAFANPSVIGASATTLSNFTCRGGALGQDSWRLEVYCYAQ